jgi:bacterioferritin-associated ferredoxin
MELLDQQLCNTITEEKIKEVSDEAHEAYKEL